MKFLKISLTVLLVSISLNTVKSLAEEYSTTPVVITKEVSGVTKYDSMLKTKTGYCNQVFQVKNAVDENDTFSAQPKQENGYKYRTTSKMAVGSTIYELDKQASHPDNFYVTIWRDHPFVGLKRMAEFIYAPNCVIY